MAFSVLFSVWTARTIGADNYGELLFAFSAVSIILTMAGLGMDHYMVQVMSSEQAVGSSYLSSLFGLRLASGLFFSILGCMVLLCSNWDESRIALCLVLGIQIPFVCLNVFHAKLKSRECFTGVAIIQLLSLLISSFVKIWVLLNDEGLIYLGWAISLDVICIALFCAYTAYAKGFVAFPLFQWKWDEIKVHFKRALFLLVGALSAILYMRVDQIMITEMLGSESTAHYGVAVRLVDSWIPLLSVFVSTALPSLTRKFNAFPNVFNEEYLKLISRLMKICCGLAVVYFFFGHQLVISVFGNEYRAGAPLCALLVWSLPFVMLSHTSWTYYLQHDLYLIGSIRLFIGAMLNIGLNIILIKSHGLMGCVIATLISYSVSSFFIHAFFSKTRKLFFLQCIGMVKILSLNSWINDFSNKENE